MRGLRVRTGITAPSLAGGWIAPRVEGPKEDGPGLWWWVVMFVAGAAAAWTWWNS